MPELVAPEDGSIDVLPIHFDVPDHYIPLRTFIDTASHAEEVIASLNAEWFSGELEYEVVVIPPKPGTFLIGLGIAVVAITAAGWKFLHSDVGKAFIRGLTGEEPAHWGEQAGRRIREKIKKPVSNIKAPPELESDITDVKAIEPADKEVAVQKASTSIILVESTKSILVKEVSELRRIGIDPQRFRETFEARNEFYRACWQEKELRAIGFDETDSFPIDRKDFARLQVPLEPREEAPTVDPSTVDVTTVTVTSPNWDRRDASRTWRGKDASGRYRFFKVTDEFFWALAEADQLNLRGLDTMKVQWAFEGRGRQAKNFRVLRVLEYNGDELAEPYDEAALNGILGPHLMSGSDQDDLFGRR